MLLNSYWRLKKGQELKNTALFKPKGQTLKKGRAPKVLAFVISIHRINPNKL